MVSLVYQQQHSALFIENNPPMSERNKGNAPLVHATQWLNTVPWFDTHTYRGILRRTTAVPITTSAILLTETKYLNPKAKRHSLH